MDIEDYCLVGDSFFNSRVIVNFSFGMSWCSGILFNKGRYRVRRNFLLGVDKFFFDILLLVNYVLKIIDLDRMFDFVVMEC